MARNKPRAWSNQVGKLPEPPSNEPSEWMQEVLREKDKRQDKTMDELMAEYATLEAEEAIAAKAQSARNVLYAAIDKRILEELAKVKQVSGQDMWRGNGHTCSPKHTPRPVIEDPEALRKWIKETGQEDQLTLPQGRLMSILTEAMQTDMSAILTPAQRAQLKPGDPGSGAPPPGVKVFLHTGVHHTTPKARPAAENPPDGDDGPF